MVYAFFFLCHFTVCGGMLENDYVIYVAIKQFHSPKYAEVCYAKKNFMFICLSRSNVEIV